MNGIFLVYKERNQTSYEVVEALKEKLKVSKAGHAGTLDPLAEGLLIIGVNEATKLLSFALDSDKEYIAEAKLGVQTDTADITGEVIKEQKVNFHTAKITPIFAKFPKQYWQQVPKYSAKKVAGKKLYQYARENETIDLPNKQVMIKELQLIAFDEKQQKLQFRAVVSKGTYIRALIEDLAEQLNAIATMSNLKRTKQGKFSIQTAKKICDITSADMLSINELLAHLPKQEIAFAKIADGQLLENKQAYDWLLLVDDNDNPLAIYQKYHKNPNLLKPWKMIKKKQ